MSSPITNTRLSRRISVRRPSEIAWRYVSSAIALLVMRRVEVLGRRVDSFEERGRLRHGRLLRAFERIVQGLLDLRRDVVLLLVGHVGVLAQPRAEALERIRLRPLLEHLLWDVERVVMDGMSLHAEGDRLDQGGAASRARLLDRSLRLPIEGQHVGAVDDHAVEPVRLRAVGNVLGRELEVRRGRIGPLVVVADEDDGQLAHAGQSHPLVTIAARGGALAEPGDGNALLLADPESERAADGNRKHRREVADHRDQAEIGVGHVDVPVLTLGRTVRAAHVLGEDPPRLDTADDVDAHVPMERRTDVVRPHRGRDADRRGLVPAPCVERAGDLPLAVEDVAALLDPAREDHVAVDAEQVLAVEARLPHLFERADGLGFPGDRHRGRTLTTRSRAPAALLAGAARAERAGSGPRSAEWNFGHCGYVLAT